LRGLHLIGDLYRCRCDGGVLVNLAELRSHCVAFCREAGLEVVGESFYQFGGAGGVTGTVLLGESHLAIHTWPESDAVTLDVYVCNYSTDNSGMAESLFGRVVTLLDPEEKLVTRVMRGKD
jgi:S-adenosylmethionine decarboxylase